MENRIPKFAFKLVLWKKGLPTTESHSVHAESSFLISTKATLGIIVNGVTVKSHQPKQPDEASKYWAEIRHGDEVMVWVKELKPYLFVKFRFECYFGASKTPRAPGTEFTVISNGELSEELDQYVLGVEQNLKATAEKKKETEDEAKKADLKEEEEREDKERGKKGSGKENDLQVLRPVPIPTA
jgi:hypothetical protein